MKVVIYFRQAGGTVAGTYPLLTHWTEDEDEQPVPLFSQFDTDAMADAAPEILVQLQSANRWLKEKRGVVVASFTEMENGSGRRPSYGAARKAAGRERAAVLIATTKALAGQRFAPISQDGLEIVRLEDPDEADRESWARSRNVVVYFRALAGPEEAQALLEKQRREIVKMLRSANVLAEFVETEPLLSAERPQLQRALALCREKKARLFIGTTDAIGDGEAFLPDFTDVPYEVAYRKAYEWPDTIPLDHCPFPIALYFGKQWTHGYVPLYLANATGGDLLDVTISGIGTTVMDGDHVETTPSRKEIDSIPSGTGRLVEAYDVYFDGDFLVIYTVEARSSDGTRYSGRAATKGIPGNRWLRIDHWKPISA
ncbi:hypothetical protein [Shinella sp. HZN7]|uniref:hypothetical protein n=1 Tax=Shinella sp. (strain HZN7) TaxID=879274 RepID=UPI0007DA85B6|nr:hypothetical protein [Shinella sp. HZN7]ANH03170.1 hypothetical protein shn_03360 [Shinella sp. HZN7]